MKPRHAQLPIWRDANRLLIEIEQAVRKFPRYHKYMLGSDLREGLVGAGLPANLTIVAAKAAPTGGMLIAAKAAPTGA